MIKVKTFVCNPFQENTYILYDDSGECTLIDPGMYTSDEQNAVVNFIASENLTPVKLLNTHCHIDHVLGNKFIYEQYGLLPQFNEGEMDMLTSVPAFAAPMGLRYDASPLPQEFLPESGTVSFGNSTLELIFAPGHSPAHLCFYSKTDDVLIGGDVLFYNSIGRTDLPGGNHSQLIQSIKTKLFELPDTCIVYPGHGPETTIRFEKLNNPYLN